MNAHEWGVKNGSCGEALEQRKNYDSQADWYRACNRGDWLIWQLERLSLNAIIPALSHAVDIIVERAIHRGLWLLRYDDSDNADVWCQWADRWLSGEDRSERAAEAAVSAARAAWIAEAAVSAASAARAAEAAVSAASAARAAEAAANAAWAVRAVRAVRAAAEAAWVANAVWVANAANAAEIAEFEQQAKDIRREIPEWPGGD